MSSAGTTVLVHDGLPIMASGLPAMAALLRDRGHEATVWNLHAEASSGIQSDLAARLEGVSILALSVHWFYQLPTALKLAREARSLGFTGYIVLGGFTASLWAGDLLKRHREIDGVVRGDGEEPLLRLAGELTRKRRVLSRVPNLVRRSRGGIAENPLSYVGGQEQLDRLEFGRLDVIEHLQAHLEHSSWRAITDGSRGVELDLGATFYLCGGRGCLVACATCGGGRFAHRTHSARRGVAFRSPERLVDDVEQALGHGCTSIHACFDPVPNGEHWQHFMHHMRSRQIHVPMIFESFGLPDEAFLDRFADTFDGGIIVISPETASEKVRKNVRGYFFSNAQLHRTLERIGQLDLHAQVFLGYLTPTETLQGLYASRRWARELQSRYPKHVQVMHYPYSTDPGSPLARRPGRFGMRCDLRRPEDWEREMEKQEPWLGNLMRHEPADPGDENWRAVTLGVEMEQACLRERPGMHARLLSRLGRGIDPFFTQVARQVLDCNDVDQLHRSRLVEFLVRSVDGAEGPGFGPGDRNLELNLGKACNNRCIFCLDGNARKEARRWVPVDRARAELERAHADGARSVGLLGGEPTAHPRILEIVSLARDLGFTRIALASNGLKLHDRSFARALVDAGATRFSLSIHAFTEQDEDFLTGRKGNFEKKLAAVHNLVAMKKEGLLRDNVSINAVLTRLISARMVDFASFWHGQGMDDVRFNLIRTDACPDRAEALTPRLRDLGAQILRTVVLVRTRLRMQVSFGDIPLCVYPWEVLQNPSLVEQIVGESRDLDTRVAVFHAPKDETVDAQRFKWSEKKKHALKIQPRDPCSMCRLAARCEGVWRSYHDLFGAGELRSL